MNEPAELENIADHTLLQASKSFDAAQKESRLCVEPERLYLTWQETKALFEQKMTLSVKKLHVSKETLSDRPPLKQFHYSVKDNMDIGLELGRHREKDLFSPLANWINHQRLSGFDTLMVCHTRTQAQRLVSLLVPYGIHLKSIEKFDDIKQSKGQAFVCLGRISSGFIWPAQSLAIITEDEIFGLKRRPKIK